MKNSFIDKFESNLNKERFGLQKWNEWTTKVPRDLHQSANCGNAINEGN